MTDSELREAAERVQAWSRTMMFGENTFTTKNQMAEAMDAVASKLLEELPPADDGESVSRDWLMSVGFKPEDGDPSSSSWLVIDNGVYEITRGDTSWMLCEKLDTDIVTLPDVKTRGHVRRLCAAMRITITEPTP